MTDPGWLIALAALAVLGWIAWGHRRGRRMDAERLERDIAELKVWAVQRFDHLDGQMGGLAALHREALDAFGEAAEQAGWRQRERRRR